jgi:hypothetical protein
MSGVRCAVDSRWAKRNDYLPILRNERDRPRLVASQAGLPRG